MKELAASLVLLFAISIHPDFCAGLECKQRTALHGPNNYTDEDIDKDSRCFSADAKYCNAAICTKDEAVSRGLTVTNLVCKCPHGAKGEDFANENFEILPIPTSNVLTCKKGAFDSEENGGTRNEECYDDDKYCYIASCAKGNELVRTEWDCSPDSDCTAISAIASESVGSKVNCECHFGRVNTSLTNENFTRPLLPTTTTDKPTTTTDKPTTTTDKPTTTTDKPTTTTDKPTNTTAEANLGVRAKISVCSGVLMAIGHVLASVLPKLGVGGQLFNDL
ncbi:hypothetical protein GPALN_003177 [Globodera pallida]|nr:hypothetical protein GPALN_003177 [Globodera pallida]